MQGLPASYIQVNLNLVLGTRSEKRNLVHAQHSSGIWYCAQGLKKGTWYMHSSTHSTAQQHLRDQIQLRNRVLYLEPEMQESV